MMAIIIIIRVSALIDSLVAIRRTGILIRVSDLSDKYLLGWDVGWWYLSNDRQDRDIKVN